MSLISAGSISLDSTFNTKSKSYSHCAEKILQNHLRKNSILFLLEIKEKLFNTCHAFSLTSKDQAPQHSQYAESSPPPRLPASFSSENHYLSLREKE
jgi:hypothetical protein